MMRSSIRVHVVVGLVAALLMMAGIGALTYRTTRRLIDDNLWVEHNYEVLMMLERTRNAIVDAETAQRGYILTKQEVLLQAKQVAMAQIDERLRALEDLTADNPLQRVRIAPLRAKIHERFALMDRAIALGGGGSRKTERASVAEQGLLSMDEVRRLIVQMEDEERRLLKHRLADSQSSARWALLADTAMFLLILALMGSIFLLIQRDVGRRKQEAELIRKSRERFELAVLGSRDGLWDWDLTTNEVYFSPRWKSMLGHEDHEIAGRFDEWISRLHPEDRDRALATVAAYHEGRIPDYELEHRLRHKDGTYRWILTRGVVLRDAAGKPYRMSGSHTDITARKESERQLAEQNRLLEQSARSEREALAALKQTQAYLVQSEKLASLGQVVGGVAHEINNPLAFVMNNVAVLKRDVGPMQELIRLYQQGESTLIEHRPDLVEPIRRISAEIDLEYSMGSLTRMIDRTGDGLGRIRQIVTDLRNFARLDEGETKESDLNTGIISTVHIIIGEARKRDVELKMDLTPLPLVLCNPMQINQVVLNLISNAIDACSRGGEVTIRTRCGDDGVEIHVLDSGQGIDPTIRHKIFDPFFTTKPVGQGTGLGLSISYGIVVEHGGRIELESTPGAGAHFIVYLPLRPARVAKSPPPGPGGRFAS